MAVGLAILVVGLVVTIEAAVFRTTVAATRSEWESEKNWEITGNLTAGNALNFSLVPDTNWSFYGEKPPPDLPIPYDVIMCDICIVDPNGGKTNFTQIYAITDQTGLYPVVKYFGAKLTSNDGGISMRDTAIIGEYNQTIYYVGIEGIVKYTGAYKVIVVRLWQPSPPRHLYLLGKRVDVKMPYLFVVPLGGLVIGFGVVLSTWAAKEPRRISRGKSGNQPLRAT
jgi:hypothetical protein